MVQAKKNDFSNAFDIETDHLGIALSTSGIYKKNQKVKNAELSKFNQLRLENKELKIKNLIVEKKYSAMRIAIKNNEEEIINLKNKIKLLEEKNIKEYSSQLVEKIKLLDELSIVMDEAQNIVDGVKYSQNQTYLDLVTQNQKKVEEVESNYKELMVVKNELQQEKQSLMLDKLNFIEDYTQFLGEVNYMLNDSIYFKNKYEDLHVKHRNMEKKYNSLEKKYVALKNSKLGKLTLKYWNYRNKGRKN